MFRRHFLAATAAVVSAGAWRPAGAQAIPPATGQAPGRAPAAPAPAGPATGSFGFEDVAQLAAERAAKPFAKPESRLAGSFADLDYDAYRGIRFRPEADPLGDHPGFAMDILPPGAIFHEPVRISLVRDGVPAAIPFDPAMLEFDRAQFPDGPDLATTGDMGWSGFRLRCPLNRPDTMDEFIVFQGASYFRAVARGTQYGLSARGLALGTGSPRGEEFPLFTDFWVHAPAEGATAVRIHAILDSLSVAGAFQFDVTPGAQTVVATRVALFPRTDLEAPGLAPLTSMFWFGPASRAGIDDYRPAVHDSDGLLMRNGAGEQLWRTLAAHKALQISGFQDRDPAGFGLIQRARSFADFQDAEARYDLRPSAWIEPEGDWGEGEVRLVEIPVDNEFNDNIVSFWAPRAPLAAGSRGDWAYRLVFAAEPPDLAPVARVLRSQAGRSISNPAARSYVIDFDLGHFTDPQLPAWEVTASAGRIVHSYVKALPDERVMRLAFEFDPGTAVLADLGATLSGAEGVLSEVWLARWTAG